MSKYVKVAARSEIAPGTAKCVELGEERIALFNVDGEFYAIDDTCTHDGASLSEGVVEGEEVECPLHAACFNLKTGEVTCPPAITNVERYNVRLVGDDIEIEQP